MASKSPQKQPTKRATKSAATTAQKPTTTVKRTAAKRTSDTKPPTQKPQIASSATTAGQDTPRKIRAPKRRLWKRVDKRFRERPRISNAWQLSKAATKLIADNWKVLGGMVLVYGVLTIILVRGLNGSTDVGQVKQQFDTLRHGVFGHLASGFSIFTLLLTSSNNTASDVAGTYQLLLILITSLAIVWVFRQRLNGVTVRIRDGFYSGMYPFVPTVLVLLVISIQLIPLLIGAWLYATIIGNNIALTGLEHGVAIVVLLATITSSFYMVCSSLFALYIVTLPGMTPLKALRSARGLVRYRRWSILRKLLFLPLILLIVGSLIMLPFILFVPILAQWIFFLLTMWALVAVHAYMYTMYRELLHD